VILKRLFNFVLRFWAEAIEELVALVERTSPRTDTATASRSSIPIFSGAETAHLIVLNEHKPLTISRHFFLFSHIHP
jgi:hypothetical protein